MEEVFQKVAGSIRRSLLVRFTGGCWFGPPEFGGSIRRRSLGRFARIVRAAVRERWVSGGQVSW
ncbi:hypothetical protein KY290_001670 [Solanum tuberosum]|uniref:Uncharacterized protein n=1 Tax=Solanum tuberosum TaxID=4113 RepID=A0ABQ7WQ32_SOLTU|nr:hypothetical protein KY290_001670 [Solanum tuberosum]